MSDMPETLWAWISTVQFVPRTQDVGELRQWWTNPPIDNPSAGTEYIRADVSAARIADLERQLAEARDKALEEAAVAADEWSGETFAVAPITVGDAIRNLKGPTP